MSGRLLEVEKLSKDSKMHRKQSEKLSEELAILHAASLRSSSSPILAVHRPTPDAQFSLTLQRELGEEKRPLLLTMGEAGAAQFVFRGEEEVVDRLGKEVTERLGGKGGGKNGRVQGKFSDVSKVGPTVEWLKSVV